MVPTCVCLLLFIGIASAVQCPWSVDVDPTSGCGNRLNPSRATRLQDSITTNPFSVSLGSGIALGDTASCSANGGDLTQEGTDVTFTPTKSGLFSITCDATVCTDYSTEECAYPSKQPTTEDILFEKSAFSGNEYYPGIDASGDTIRVGSAYAEGTGGRILEGDTLLVIQMKGASYDMTPSTWGNGDSDQIGTISDDTFPVTAGRYEYAIAKTDEREGYVTLVNPLRYQYANRDQALGESEVRSVHQFQVVKVVSAQRIFINEGVTIRGLPWDPDKGAGGVVAFDTPLADGAFRLEGTIDVIGQGFQGGYGQALEEEVFSFPGEGITTFPERTNGNGGKAWNTAPKDSPDQCSVSSGNGGGHGCGTAGGGGGSTKVALGGQGAGDADKNLPGFGADRLDAALVKEGTTRVFLGGGGGAGGTFVPSSLDPLHSGQAGGGIVMIRAGTIQGSGTILANGDNSGCSETCATSRLPGGGGGGGGTILLFSQNIVGDMLLSARGGEGGSVSDNPAYAGGGGGGGLVWMFADVDDRVQTSVAGGAAGTDRTEMEATPGGVGQILSVAQCCPIVITQNIRVCGPSQYVSASETCVSCSAACDECLSSGNRYNPSTGPCLQCALLDMFESQCVPSCTQGQEMRAGSPQVCQFTINDPNDTQIDAGDATHISVSGQGGGGPENTVHVTVSTLTALPAQQVIPDSSGDWILTDFNVSSIYFSSSPTIMVSVNIRNPSNDVTSSQSYYLDIPRELYLDVPIGEEGTVNQDVVAIRGNSTKQVAVELQDSQGYRPPEYLADPNSNGQWGIAIDLSAMAEGEILVFARIFDTLGSTEKNATFLLDRIAPELEIVEPADGSFLSDTVVLVAGTTDLPNESIVTLTVTGLPDTWELPVTDGAYSTSVDLMDAPDGDISFAVTATDSARNSHTETVTVTKDSGMPLISIAVPVDMSYINKDNAASYLIYGTTSDLSPGVDIEIELGGRFLDTAVIGLDGQFSISVDTTAVTDGTWNLVLFADERPGKNATATRTLVKDVSPPSLVINSPSPDSYVNLGNQDSVVITGSSNGDLVRFLVNDAEVADPIVGADVDSFPHAIDLSALEDGSFTLDLVAMDAAGNANTVPINLLKDTIAPTLSIISPKEGQLLNSDTASSLRVRGGTDSSLVDLQFEDDFGKLEIRPGVPVTAGSWSMVNDCTQILQDGQIVITATASDPAGNEALKTVTVTMDTRAPIVILNEPIDGSMINEQNETSVSIEGSTNIDAVDVQLTIGGVLQTDSITPGAAFNFPKDFSGYPNGVIEITVTAKDSAGNQATTTHTISKESTLTSVHILSPTSLKRYGIDASSNLELRGTSSDDVQIVLTGDLGGNNSTSLSPLASGEWAIIVNMTDFPSGRVNMTVEDSTTSDTILFFLDLDAPVLVLETPANGSYVNLNTIEALSVTGHVDYVGANIEVMVDDVPQDAPASPDMSFSGIYNLSSVATSPFVFITVTVTDDADNTVSTTHVLSVDVELPQVSILSPSSNELIGLNEVPNFIISGTASDNLGTVKIDVKVTDQDNQAVFTSISPPPGAWNTTLNITTLSDGPIELRLNATDVADNLVTKSLNFTLDTAAPIVQLAYPTPGYLNFEQSQSFLVNGSSNAFLEEHVLSVGVNVLTTNTSDAEGVLMFSDVDVTTFEEGPLTIYVSTTDPAGNVGEDSITMTKDTIPPSLVITAPLNGSYINQTEASSVLFEGLTDGSNLTLLIDGVALSQSGYTTGVWNVTVDLLTELPLGNGWHVFSISAVDLAGNSFILSNWFLLDTTPPTVNILQPEEGSVLRKGVISVIADVNERVNASLSFSGTDRYRCVFNNTLRINMTESTDPFSDGPVLLLLEVEDVAGNTALASRNFTIDTTAPQLVLTEPANGTYINANQETFTVAGQSDADHVLVSYDMQRNVSVVLGSFSVNLSSSYISDGDNLSILVVAEDDVDNQNTTSVIVIRDISVNRPIIKTPDPATTTLINAMSAPAVRIAGTSQEEVVILSVLEVFNQTVSTVDGAFEYTWNATSLPEGSYQIIARNTDPAGNSAFATANVTLDLTAPSVTITRPLPGQMVFSSNQSSVQLDVLTDNTAIPSGASLYVNGTFNRAMPVRSGNIKEFLNFTSYPDGSMNLTVVVTDSAGNEGSDQVIIMKDTAPDRIEILAPTNDTLLVNSTIVVTGHSSADKVEVLCIGSTPGDSIMIPQNTMPNGSWNVSFTVNFDDQPLRIIASATSENPSSTEVRVTLDARPPVVVVQSPQEGSVYGKDNITNVQLLGTIESTRSSVVYVSANQGPETLVPIVDGSFTKSLNLSGLSDGSIRLEAKAYDIPWIGTGITDIIKDTTTSVTIVTPVNGTMVNNYTLPILQVSGFIAEPAALIISFANEISNWTTSSKSVEGEWSIGNFALPNFSDGRIDITAVAVDNAGNQGSSSSYIILDTREPLVVIDRPVDQQILNQQDDYIYIDGRTDQPEDTTVAITITNGAAVVARAFPKQWQTFTESDGSFSTFTATSDIPDGDVLISIMILDAARNVYSRDIKLFKDTIPPIGDMNLVAGDDVINIAEMTSFTISGTGEPQSIVHLTLDLITSTVTSESSSSVTVDASGEWSYDFSFSTTSDGRLVITMVIEDQAGNKTPPQSKSVLIDATEPSISIDPISVDDRITQTESNNVPVLGSSQVPDGTTVNVVVRSTSGVVARSNAEVVGARWGTNFDLSTSPLGTLTVVATVFSTNGNVGRAQRTLTKQADIPTATATATRTSTASPSSSASLSLGASSSPSISASISLSATASLSLGASPSTTTTPSATRTNTPSPSPTPSVTPSRSFINLVHAGSIPSSAPVLSASASASRPRPASASRSPAPCEDCQQTAVIDIPLSTDRLSEEDVSYDLSLPGEDRPVGSVTFPAGLLPPNSGDVTIRIEITRNNDPDTKKSFAGDLTTDITIVDNMGASIKKFDNSLEICLSASGLPEDDEDEKCLGYYDEDRGRWICEDSCPKKNEESGQRCGSTDHLTSFALLLQGGARGNKNPCGDDESYTLAWISLALIITALLMVSVSVILIEIRMRYKVHSRSKAFDAMSRRAQSLANR